MILVQGWVRASAEEIERLRPAAIEMMRATKVEEPGCLEYAYAVDLADPGLMHVVERWTDDAALTAHFATPHMAAFNTALAGMRIDGALVKAYAGEEARTLAQR